MSDKKEENQLKRATSILRSALEELESSPQASTSHAAQESTSQARTTQAEITGKSTSSASENFRRLYPGMCSRNVTRRLDVSQGCSSAKRPKMLGYLPVRFKAQETWTKDICILAKCNESSTPDRERMATLMEAGLGKMKVVFPNKNASHDELQAFLENKFPRLKDGGGYEIVRAVGGGGGQRSLSLIPPGREGYSLPHIKERIGQAVLFIRPLQVDLDETPLADKVDDEAKGPLLTCLFCNNKFTITGMKLHQKECEEKLAIIGEPDDDTGNSTGIGVKDIHSSTEPSSSCSKGDSRDNQIEEDRKLAELLATEDDDDDLPSVLSSSAASFQSSNEVMTERKSKANSLAEALHEACLTSNSSVYPGLNLFVQRRKALQNALEELKSCKLNTSQISVEFVGEPAADTGGPTRELFSIAFNQLIDAKLTRGSFPNMTFMHDQSALLEGDYKALGQLVALSLLNGAGGPHLYCPLIAHFLLGTEDKLDCSGLIEQLPQENHDVKEKLRVLSECTEPDAWKEAVIRFDERFEMGINKATIPLSEKEAMIRAAVKHMIVSSVFEEVQSFQEGLSSFGVLDILKQYPEDAFKEFTFYQMTVEDARKPFVPVLAVKGSTKRGKEELILYNYNQFLKKCSSGMVQRTVVDLDGVLKGELEESESTKTLTLNDIYQFITSLRYPPPGGIEASIEFQHTALPGTRVKANTCANLLTFPVNARYATEEYAVFSSNFADDIFDGPGYGCV